MPCSPSDLTRVLEGTIRRRHEDPVHLIRTVMRIPQQAKRAFFAFKIFSLQIHQHMHRTPGTLITAIQSELQTLPGNDISPTKPVFIVNYRRRIIEKLVSDAIARNTGHWSGEKTTEKNAVTLGKTETELYVRSTTAYFEEARRALENNNIQYNVFEYSRDLL